MDLDLILSSQPLLGEAYGETNLEAVLRLNSSHYLQPSRHHIEWVPKVPKFWQTHAFSKIPLKKSGVAVKGEREVSAVEMGKGLKHALIFQPLGPVCLPVWLAGGLFE